MSVEPKEPASEPGRCWPVRLFRWWLEGVKDVNRFQRARGEGATFILLFVTIVGGGFLLVAFVLPVVVFIITPVMAVIAAWWTFWMHLTNFVMSSH